MNSLHKMMCIGKICILKVRSLCASTQGWPILHLREACLWQIRYGSVRSCHEQEHRHQIPGQPSEKSQSKDRGMKTQAAAMICRPDRSPRDSRGPRRNSGKYTGLRFEWTACLSLWVPESCIQKEHLKPINPGRRMACLSVMNITLIFKIS